jgi:hypothetical protein
MGQLTMERNRPGDLTKMTWRNPRFKLGLALLFCMLCNHFFTAPIVNALNLRFSIYADVKDVNRYLSKSEGREKVASILHSLKISNTFLEGSREDDYLPHKKDSVDEVNSQTIKKLIYIFNQNIKRNEIIKSF